MPGLVPGISLSQTRRTLGERVDGRDKPGHDVLGFPAMHTNFSIRTLGSDYCGSEEWFPVVVVCCRRLVG